MRFATGLFVFGFTALVGGACGGSSDGSGDPTDPPSSSQTGSVRGVVRDDAAAGVPGATVQLAATGKTTRSTTTGSDGSYSFSAVATGTWQVIVVAPAGYGGGSNPVVTVNANQESTVALITLTKLAPGGAPTSATVIMYQNAFVPANVTVKAGGTVTWRNTDSEQHNATGAGIDTGNLSTNASGARTFQSVGTFNYTCTLHSGMNGSVTVVQ